MKKIFNIIIGLLVFIPFLSVDALKCYSEVIDVDVTHSFTCVEVEGETLTFNDSTNAKDYKDFFTYLVDKESKKADINISETIVFDSVFPSGFIKIGDGSDEAVIQVKNKAYVEPTTTTTTTTTKDPNIKTFTVTLNPNNGDEVSVKTCDVTSNNETCSVTLPKIDKDTFNGWGTANTCKEGNSGTIKVDKDITYYACYTDNDTEQNENVNTTLYLKTLSLVNKTTNENIDFGTFSIKRTDYSFKVLNSVENIDVVATSDEGVNIEISGNENLLVGENKIIVKLTDDNNNQNEYTFVVTRLNEGETINSVHYLKSLIVGGYDIGFDKERLVYSLTIPNNIEKLEITAIAENNSDTVEIKNNENLIDGSQILINVTDENDVTSYLINITKESSTNYLLLGGIGLILVLIIILIILIIIKSNKKKQGKPNIKNSNDKIEVLNI